jgi:hypothetical protein
MMRSYVVPMRWMVIYKYEIPGGALNLRSTKLPRPWSPWESSPSRKNLQGRTRNRTRDLMISSQTLTTRPRGWSGQRNNINEKENLFTLPAGHPWTGAFSADRWHWNSPCRSLSRTHQSNHKKNITYQITVTDASLLFTHIWVLATINVNTIRLQAGTRLQF